MIDERIKEIKMIKNESQSSVELVKNTRGYNFTIKLYDFEDGRLQTRLENMTGYVEKTIRTLERNVQLNGEKK